MAAKKATNRDPLRDIPYSLTAIPQPAHIRIAKAYAKTFFHSVRKVIVAPYTKVRWFFHRDKYRIPKDSIAQYKNIFFRAIKVTGEVPNLFEGDDYNNKIRWAMVFEKDPLIVQCTDKLAVRDYVENSIGHDYLNRIYETYSSADDIDFEKLPSSFVIKTNHDSGSVWIIRKNQVDFNRIRSLVSDSLAKRNYGWKKGEWAYRQIEPAAFSEELLSDVEEGIPDFKFHCAAGYVSFVQFIYDRLSNSPKEIILSPNGNQLPWRLDENFNVGENFDKPLEWSEMIKVAEHLSKPFNYVRVDLYVSDFGVRFGELTFSPRAGNYRGKGQSVLGSVLRIHRDRF